MTDFNSMMVGDLRKELRARFPQCRGAFAAQATKDECVAILEGRDTPENVMQAWHAKQMGTTTPDLPEGVAGDNAPADGKPVAPAASSDDLKAMMPKAIAALRGFMPQVAVEIERLIEVERTKVEIASPDASTDLVATDGRIKIAGVEVPVIIDGESDAEKQDSRLAYVPNVDDNFRFDIWRAQKRSGAVTYRQKFDDVIILLMSDERVLLVGPPAVGKTSAIEQFAARCNWPVVRFNGNRDVTVQDFVGNYEACNGSTQWVDGPLVQAMKIGAILVLDEVDHMPAECSSVLHSVLEHGGKLVITGNGGEIVDPHPNFRIVATANTAGFGDTSGLHPNAQVQDAAFLSRFDSVFHVTWMTPAAERNLLVASYGIDKDEADLMVKVAKDSRKAADNGDLMQPVTLRQTQAWARLTKTRDLATAFALSVLNKAPDCDTAALAEIAQRHFGDKLNGKAASTEEDDSDNE